MRINFTLVLCLFVLTSCIKNAKETDEVPVEEDYVISKPTYTLPKGYELTLKKEFLYNQYTLEDYYQYKDTFRVFQWNKIREGLALVDSIQKEQASWGILQNRRNVNKEAPLVKDFLRNDFTRVTDTFGVERHQSVPLYFLTDAEIPYRYGRDGSLVKIKNREDDFTRIETVFFKGEWMTNSRYVKPIADTAVFYQAVFVDRENQNIATFEKKDSVWLVRSMNPSTTGLHKPPHQKETPLGIYVIQEKKTKMYYYHDGTTTIAGYSPTASRFCCGAYIHGVPVNLPRTAIIEYSNSLGTTPRSHMCVRTASSHAQFVYDWSHTGSTIVFVIGKDGDKN